MTLEFTVDGLLVFQIGWAGPALDDTENLRWAVWETALDHSILRLASEQHGPCLLTMVVDWRILCEERVELAKGSFMFADPREVVSRTVKFLEERGFDQAARAVLRGGQEWLGGGMFEDGEDEDWLEGLFEEEEEEEEEED